MNLSDLKNNPTNVKVNLQIAGPSGASTGAEEITVDSRVVTPTSDVAHSETIKCFKNAVSSAEAEIGGLQGTTQKIMVETGGTNNCYWLPWGSGKIYMGQLGGLHDYFFTYTINGCGVLIAGTSTQPIVAHANLESDRLTASVMKGMTKMGLKPSNQLRDRVAKEVAKEQSITYEQFYGNLAMKLIDEEELSGPSIEIVTPDQYLIRAGAGFGAVFGIKGIGNAWTFYGNWSGQTKQIWG